MAACNDRQLTDAQRQAAFAQQRAAIRAIRPFSGQATAENIADYLNRELFPVLKQARTRLDEVYLQTVDNAPSANPLTYYFSANTANADPTTGFVRLNQATQDTATIVRVSQSNSRLQDTAPWLEVMQGSATAPLGVITMTDAINPGRFVRWDLTAMVDQGAYWDLTVSPIESSDDNPFRDEGAVVISFIAGVASGGTTVGPGSITPIADETFLGNVSGGVAAPSAIALSSLAGDGLAWDAANNQLDVTGSTSITITADQVQRSALTGDITALANSNTTAFRSFLGLSVLARAANTSGGPTELTGTAAHQLLKMNAAGTSLVFETLALAAFPTIADDTFLANISGGTAVPSAVALTTLAGAGLTGGADAILNVGAGTGITVNANDVQLAAISAETFFGNFTAGSAVGTARAGSSVAGAGLTYTAGGTLAVGAGTNVTVNANDVAVDDYPLSGLADQAANTYVANGTAGSAAPTAIAVSAESIPARTSGNLSQLTSAAQSILMRAAGSLFFGTAAADQTLRRSGSGDLGFGTLVTNNIGDDQVTFPKMVNIATDSLIGRDTAGTGDPEVITLGNGLEMTGAGALRIDEDASFAWQGIHDFSNEVRANDTGSIALTSGASNNNMAIAGSSNFLVFLTGVLAGTTDLTGIAAPSGSGKRLMFVLNNCTGTSVWVRNQSASSTAANRIQCPTPTADLELASADWMILFYTGSQWNVVSYVQGLGANTIAANALTVTGKARGVALGNEEIVGRLNGNITNITLSSLGGAGVAWNSSTDRFELVACTQAEQETGTATTTGAVTPGRQHFHPSAVKGWVKFLNATIQQDYNVSTITDNGVGDWTINWDTDFSGASNAVAITAERTGGGSVFDINIQSVAAASCQVICVNRSSGAAEDPTFVHAIACGDH